MLNFDVLIDSTDETTRFLRRQLNFAWVQELIEIDLYGASRGTALSTANQLKVDGHEPRLVDTISTESSMYVRGDIF